MSKLTPVTISTDTIASTEQATQGALATETSSTTNTVATPSVTSTELNEEREKVMEAAQDGVGSGSSRKAQTQAQPTADADAEQVSGKHVHTNGKSKKSKKKMHGKCSKSKRSKKAAVESSSEDSSSESADDEGSSSSDEETSEDQRECKRKAKPVKKKKVQKEKAKHKEKEKAKAKRKATTRKRKSKKHESSSGESDSESDSDSDSESSFSSSSSSSSSDSETERRRRRKRKTDKTVERLLRRAMRTKEIEYNSTDSSERDQVAETTPPSVDTPVAGDAVEDPTATELELLLSRLLEKKLQKLTDASALSSTKSAEGSRRKKEKTEKKKDKNSYKRVDHVWDNKLRDWKITDSAEKQPLEVDTVFTVRRTFTWENKFNGTLLDIQSSLLQEALQDILKDVKGLSLVDETPAIDPNLLFLYHDELRTYYRKTLKARLRKTKKRKQKKQLERQITQCKLLSGYLLKDYESVRKRLYPMLKTGNITYDLIWALFKPNTIAYSHTYGNKEDPRCFKADSVMKEVNFMGEEWWTIEGRYLEYDGTTFGLGEHTVRIEPFKGPRKISSLHAYPLFYHKDPEGLRKQLIERGKNFVALQGMNYRYHTGLAYQKVKRSVMKHNIDSRVMVDPAIFRRINPNYPLSYIKADGQNDSDDDNNSDCCASCSDCENDEDEEKTRIVVFKDKKGNFHLAEVPAGGSVADLTAQKLESVEKEDGSTQTFTEEELLISSPVVLGFSFSEKLWLEFSLSGIKDITWNSEAFESLVLPDLIKQNLKGLVSSHRFNAAKTIDDVIQGKGKGLNVVLHGPPGVGKTLTAESIADFLKCPLYAVSAGELGTNSRTLEADLNRIMEITHSWGAILLLDEADVFLEQRQAQDIHRNALVSVFLRLLEYYQGILFLTTNRVGTFDEAFQSRIHMGIRYEDLTPKARREIWQHHVRKLEALKDQESIPLTQTDYDQLSKKALNGRQIRIAVSTAQSIALVEEKPFSIDYIRRYLEANEDFQSDMKGGARGSHANLYT